MTPKLLLLTNDRDLEEAAQRSSQFGGFHLTVGRKPDEGARLLSAQQDRLDAIIVDLDSCDHGAAWLGALSTLPRKIPAIAVSRLDRRFMEPLANKHGVQHWISKPVTPYRLAATLKPICGLGWQHRLSSDSES